MEKRPLKVHTAQEAADGKPRQNKGNSKRNRNNIDLSLYLQKKTRITQFLRQKWVLRLISNESEAADNYV